MNTILTAFALFAFCPLLRGEDAPTSLEGGLSDAQLILDAKQIVNNLPYDHRQPPLVTRTTHTAMVCFPRIYFPNQSPTNGPAHAATVFLDDRTGDLLPNPGLSPLSDEDAIAAVRRTIPDKVFERLSASVSRRAASFTVVSLFEDPVKIPPSETASPHPRFIVWIDTATQFVLCVSMSAD